MKTWFDITNKATSTEIRIHDEIGGWGVSGKDFINALDQVPATGPVNLHINSPGGSVIDGTAIFNRLKSFGDRLTTYVDGIAASIASYIALAGAKLVMPANTYLMAHDPSGLVMGPASDMRKMADVLDKMKDNIATVYANKTGKSLDVIKTMMSDESWFTANEAKDYGLADEVTGALEVTNSVDLTKFTNLPAALKTATNKPVHIMNKLLEKLVALKLIATAQLSEDDIVAQVDAALKNHGATLKSATDRATKAEADLKAANAKLAENWVTAAVASKKIKEDEQTQALWTTMYLTDAVQAQATLDSITATTAPAATTPAKAKAKPAGAHDPLPINPGMTADSILDKFNAMEDGPEKDKFLAENSAALLKFQRKAEAAAAK